MAQKEKVAFQVAAKHNFLGFHFGEGKKKANRQTNKLPQTNHRHKKISLPLSRWKIEYLHSPFSECYFPLKGHQRTNEKYKGKSYIW